MSIFKKDPKKVENIETAKKTYSYFEFCAKHAIKRSQEMKGLQNPEFVNCMYHPEGPSEGVRFTREISCGDGDLCYVSSFLKDDEFERATYEFVIDGKYYDVEVQTHKENDDITYWIAHEVPVKDILLRRQKYKDFFTHEDKPFTAAVARTTAHKYIDLWSDKNNPAKQGTVEVQTCYPSLDSMDGEKVRLPQEVVAKIDKYFDEYKLIEWAKSCAKGKGGKKKTEGPEGPQGPQ